MRQADERVELAIARELAGVRAARRAALQHVGDHARVEVVRNSLLLTSEPVSNAIQHTDAGCLLTVDLDLTRDRLHVADGLQLVDQRSSRWGVDSATSHKTVRFEIDGLS